MSFLPLESGSLSSAYMQPTVKQSQELRSKQIQRGKYPPSLYKRLTGVYNLEHVHAIQWGCQNETEAMKKFEEVTGMKVERMLPTYSTT
ncbi:hypothetical protein QE152_g25368 [Popillia japonica]|uniref:Uncharacterized protein n=1 Tax=Popillia japonica TaxID=7064 RepID=A0AAW1K287_POPJA